MATGLVTSYIAINGPGSFTFIYDRFPGFVTAGVLMSVVQSILCYASSFHEGRLLALVGNSGNVMYDVSLNCLLERDRLTECMQFFIGRELNPSIGGLDIKSFNELRPGLILWALIDISMACAQAVRRGGHVTDSMWLVLGFQLLYVADSLYYEVRPPLQKKYYRA